MAVITKVELDCEKLREQLRELVKEIVDEIVTNGPIVVDDQYVHSPNAEQIARNIAQLINGSPIT